MKEIEDEITSLKESVRSKWPKESADYQRFLEKFTPDNFEVVLVCRLGIIGVECLRNAIKLVTESFLEKRTQLVCSIVNLVSKAQLEENECKYSVIIMC